MNKTLKLILTKSIPKVGLTYKVFVLFKAFENYYLNSLVIHQVKAEEITTAKEVSIPGLN